MNKQLIYIVVILVLVAGFFSFSSWRSAYAIEDGDSGAIGLFSYLSPFMIGFLIVMLVSLLILESTKKAY